MIIRKGFLSLLLHTSNIGAYFSPPPFSFCFIVLSWITVFTFGVVTVVTVINALKTQSLTAHPPPRLGNGMSSLPADACSNRSSQARMSQGRPPYVERIMQCDGRRLAMAAGPSCSPCASLLTTATVFSLFCLVRVLG